MATADLGVRIVLNDGASSGLNALGLSFLGLNGTLGRLMLLMNSGLSSNMKSVGAAALLTGDAFSALSGFVLDTVHAAADLQSEMAKLSNSVDGANTQMDAMKQTLITVADSSIYSTKEVADGFAQMGIDGYNATQIMSGMGQQGVVLAEALNSDTTPAFNLLATSMELYRADASQAADYTNNLTFLFYHGEKTIANVQAALQQVGPTASMLKIPFGELADVLALLGEDGLKGGQGAASLNYYLTALSSPLPKAQKALAALGLLITNETTPAVSGLVTGLRDAGASAQSLKLDGTVTQLQSLFNEAVKLGTIHTDKTFMEWAVSVGAVTNKMYDANGQFIGLRESILKLGNAMQGMTEQQKTDYIANLFNVRSGRVARDMLTDIETQLSRLNALDASRVGTNAADKAAVNLNTLNNVIQRLQTTWTDFEARLGEMDLGPLSALGNKVADLLHLFNVAPSSVHEGAGAILLVVTAFTGLAFVVTTVIFIVGVFGAAIATAFPVILGVAAAIGFVAAAAAGLAWGFQQAQDKTSQFYGVLHPFFGFLGNAFGQIKSLIMDQLLPALGNLGLNINTLKVIGIILLAAFIVPLFLAIGLVVGAVLAVVFVVTKLVQVLSWVKDRIGDLLGAAGNFIGFLVGTFNNGLKLVQTIFTTVFTAIGNFFPWLYNHNTYVKDLVDFIKFQIGVFQNIFNAAKQVVQVVWNALWDNTVGRAQQALGVLGGILNSVKEKVQGPFNDVKNWLGNFFGNLGKIIHDAGANLIHMLIQGIQDQLGQLKNVLGNVGGTIANFLGFHSPTKEGPGATADTWMPNMMRMLSSGIETHIPLVANSANKAAMAIGRVGTLSHQYAAANLSSSSSSGAAGNGDIHVYIDGQEVTGRVLQRVSKTLSVNGINRTMR